MSATFSQHLAAHPDGGHSLCVRITPGSRRAHIKADRSGVRVYVGEPVEGGRAVDAAIAALARRMGRPRSAFSVMERGDESKSPLEVTLRVAPL